MTISQSFIFKQYFLNTLSLLDWYDCDREQAWKEIQRCLNRSHFRFTARLLRSFHSIVPISSLWNARKSSHSRFIGKWISSWLADRLFSEFIILVIWLNKFIHNVFLLRMRSSLRVRPAQGTLPLPHVWVDSTDYKYNFPSSFSVITTQVSRLLASWHHLSLP